MYLSQQEIWRRIDTSPATLPITSNEQRDLIILSVGGGLLGAIVGSMMGGKRSAMTWGIIGALLGPGLAYTGQNIFYDRTVLPRPNPWQ